MLKINKKIEYGVIALLHLAAEPKAIASCREISLKLNISETLLSKIMQKLKIAGFVEAVHGNQGGYRLCKSLGDINLLDLIQTLGGPVRVAECLDSKAHCPLEASCSIVTPMSVLNQRIIHLFQATSLEALATNQKVSP